MEQIVKLSELPKSTFLACDKKIVSVDFILKGILNGRKFNDICVLNDKYIPDLLDVISYDLKFGKVKANYEMDIIGQQVEIDIKREDIEEVVECTVCLALLPKDIDSCPKGHTNGILYEAFVVKNQ